MSHVAEFTIPPEAFPFGRTLVQARDVEIEVDQIVPTDESALPFFWVRGCDPDEFMAYAEREPAVSDTRRLERVEDVALFRAEWRPDADLIDGLRRLDVTIVEAVGTADNWRLEVRTQDRETFREFQRVFEDQGIPIDLIRMYDLGTLIDDGRMALTPNQRETLLIAYQDGYFEQPREATQADVAAEFGVSRRAISDRLRRGIRNLIADALLPDSGDERE